MTAETGSTGVFKHGFEFPHRADPFAARELVDLGRHDGARPADRVCSHRHAVEVALEARMPRVDQQEQRGRAIGVADAAN